MTPGPIATDAPDERRERLAKLLREEVGRLLGIAPDRLPPDRAPAALGLDSLTAVELNHALETRLGTGLPLGRLLEGATFAALAGELDDVLGPGAAPAPLLSAPPAPASPGSQPRQPGEAEQWPLSFGQEALWFMQRLAPESALFNVAAAARVRRSVDVGAVGRAFLALLARHPALTATFWERTPGEAVQRVGAVQAGAFQAVDAAPWPEAALRSRLAAEARRPFDLARGPLARLWVAERGPRGCVLLLVVHHLAADYWSMSLLAHDLAVLYRAASGAAVAPPAAAWRYGDYVHWQRQRLASPRGEALWSYWREQLTPLTHFALRGDRPRPAAPSFAGAARGLRLDSALTAGLRRLARERRVTLYGVLLAALQALLYRLSGERRLPIGSPLAGRNDPRWSGVVGYFVNMVVMRGEVAPELGFDQLLERTHQRVLGALDHQEFPLLLLARRLQPERGFDPSPLFQVGFALQGPRHAGEANLAAFGLELEGAIARVGGLELESVALPKLSSELDLALIVAAVDDDLAVQLEYATDLFDATTVLRLLAQIQSLLSDAAAGGTGRIDELPLLSAAERQQMLREWQSDAQGGGTGDASQPRSLVAAWRRAAASWAERVAVSAHGRDTRYRELAHRAVLGAAVLRRAGVAAEVRVAVVGEAGAARAADLIAAWLAVLEAGGACVPLAVDGPPGRWRGQLERSGAAVIVAPAALLAELPEHGAEEIALDLLWQGEDEEEAEPPGAAPLDASVRPAPEDLAWVVHTSGASGRPRGVGVEHRTLAAWLWRWTAEMATWAGSREAAWGVLGAGPRDTVESLSQVLTPLCLGGRVVVAPGREREAAAGEPSPAGPLLWSAAPAEITAALQRAALPPGVTALRWSGEPMRNAQARRLDDAALAWLTGVFATASTGDVLRQEAVRREDGVAVQAPWRPLDGVRVYVLDGGDRPAPVGTAGRLAFGGGALGRCVQGDAAETARRWAPDPFAPEPGARMVRTRDRARWDAHGRLELLGPAGRSVRVGGRPLDLEQVETALLEIPGVEEAVATWHPAAAAPAAAAGGRLEVHIAVERTEAPPDRDEIAAHLRRWLRVASLPPLEVVVVRELPRTPGGRYDRVASPAPRGVTADGPPAAPRDIVERSLVEVWEEVLGRSPIGIHDNFFALGGHSLLALRLVARVREALGRDVSAASLLERPTVAGLAGVLAAAPDGERWTAPPLVALQHPDGAPLSFAQERLWLLSRLEAGETAYNMTAAMRVRGRLDGARLARALEEVARRHQVLRSCLRPWGDSARQWVAAVPRLGVPRVDLTGRDVGRDAARRAAEIERCIGCEARRPFDLAAGSMLRLLLLDGGESEQVLMINLPHVAGDGWSVALLVRELEAIYGGASAALPALAVQYADYATWQRRWLQGEVLERGLAYWRGLLADMPDLLDLPVDRPRPPVRRVRGGWLRLHVSGTVWGAARHLGRTWGVSDFMLLLAAWQVLLARWCDCDRVVVGAPSADRERAELAPLVGFFVNLLALPLRVVRGSTFRALLDQVREVCLGAFRHQEVPFEMLVAALGRGGSLSYTPLVQAVFALQQFELPAVRLGDALLTPIDRGGAAKFDLTLEAFAADDELQVRFEYSRDLFDAATLERLGRRLAVLLERAGESPRQDVWDLPLLAAEECQQLAREWPQGAGEQPCELPAASCGTVAAQWRRAAAAWASRIAVAAGATVVTYGELADLVRRGAAVLRRMGVQAEVRVAVLVEPSPRLVATVLAVLEAGGACVPVPIDAPREWWTAELEGAAAQVVVAPRSRLADLPEHGGESLAVEALWEATGEPLREVREEDRGAAALDGDNLAWVAHSAGSGRRPRALALPHRTIVDWLRQWRREIGAASRTAGGAMRPVDGMEGDWGVLAASLAGTVASLFELLAPLLAGGRVVLGPGGALRPAQPGRLVWSATPAEVTEALRRAGPPAGVTALRWSGEPLAPALALRLAGAGVEYAWGVWATPAAGAVAWQQAAAGEPSRSGRRGGAPASEWERYLPAVGVRAYVIDRGGQLAAAGGVGELAVGGAGLARSYLGRPDETAERFVPDPFSDEPGVRLYRTGDRARWDGTGRLELWAPRAPGGGRGAAEVEAALHDCPGIAEAVVSWRRAPPGAASPRSQPAELVAYMAGRDGNPPSVEEVRQQLRHRLPEELLPVAIVAVATLPRTPGGRYDRRALPEVERPFVEPRSEGERMLAEIWREILGVERVAAHDDFFALGGTSLSALTVAGRIHAACGVELPLEELFRRRTLAALSLAVEDALVAQLKPDELAAALSGIAER
jgi:non-ribosomal peptide synthetase component F/acyl carrier protein